MIRLGVNIDHVATLRQARGGREPDPAWAAALAELAGADGITVHLREDRRHIQDRDLRVLRETVRTRLNLEAAATSELVSIALNTRPDQVTFVPERRMELTTEGGLDLIGHRDRVAEAVSRCLGAGIEVSLFLDPDPVQIELASAVGALAVELHTGRYADAPEGPDRRRELQSLIDAGRLVRQAGLSLHAGHGLNLQNVPDVARIPGMLELNIGHSIISRAVFLGIERAVTEMKRAILDSVSGRPAEVGSGLPGHAPDQ
ncbi:pyridoxine 5'-phosphate synthase [Tautonia plasticadhaerens]|uniref:Pyridoxine 5'-phosphate synthase n=1 Tax=Tautonia plasticadhaerens TaxID=2527974 RepID=A0A518H8X0_9BACT|nr:pyridoxine 5'-phosphate synthase [Tautonia plasticadhaerens]QDV37295.1 Pyridoxine 5'-phosphate synthase [Tautonia plasticadhaerens]